MIKQQYLVLAVMLCISLSAISQEVVDITEQQLASIETAFNCDSPRDQVEQHACSTIKEFRAAETPDMKLFESATVSKNVRLLGVSSVFGESKIPQEKSKGAHAHAYVTLFEGRHSSNFHEKISFPNGATTVYIWPTREEEKQAINDEVEGLLQGVIDKNNPAIQYAIETEFDLETVKQSSGTSLLIGGPNQYFRYKDNRLLLIELEKNGSSDNKIFVSSLSLASRL